MRGLHPLLHIIYAAHQLTGISRQSPSVSACGTPGAESSSDCITLKLPTSLHKNCKLFVFPTCYGFEQTQCQSGYLNAHVCQKTEHSLWPPTKLLMLCFQNA